MPLRLRALRAARSAAIIGALGPVGASVVYGLRALHKAEQARAHGVEIPRRELVRYALLEPYREPVRLAGFLAFLVSSPISKSHQ